MDKTGLYDGAGSEWDESAHPRDEAGKFTETESVTDTTELEREPDDISTLLGEEFTGYKGQAAVDKLLQEKRGHVKAAFHRDDIGDIDLLWGSKTVGLQHIIERREKQGIDTQSFFNNLSDVVEKGIIYKKTSRGDFELWHNGKMAVIAAEYHGNKITYLLTAYKRTKIKAPQ